MRRTRYDPAVSAELAERGQDLPLAPRPTDPLLQLHEARLPMRGVAYGVAAGVAAGALGAVAPALLGLALFPALITGFLVALGSSGRTRREAVVAFADLGVGKIDAARATFEGMLETGSRQRRWIGGAGLGYVEMRCGNVERALEIYSEVMRSAGWQMRPYIADSLAMAYALAGQQSAAERWLEHATSPALGILGPRLVVLTRGGRYREALATEVARPQTPQLVEAVVHEIRLVSLMRAFCRHQLDPSDAAIADELRGAAPQRADEYDYLVADWPELAEFLARVDLETAPAHAELPTARLVTRSH